MMFKLFFPLALLNNDRNISMTDVAYLLQLWMNFVQFLLKNIFI